MEKSPTAWVPFTEGVGTDGSAVYAPPDDEDDVGMRVHTRAVLISCKQLSSDGVPVVHGIFPDIHTGFPTCTRDSRPVTHGIPDIHGIFHSISSLSSQRGD